MRSASSFRRRWNGGLAICLILGLGAALGCPGQSAPIELTGHEERWDPPGWDVPDHGGGRKQEQSPAVADDPMPWLLVEPGHYGFDPRTFRRRLAADVSVLELHAASEEHKRTQRVEHQVFEAMLQGTDLPEEETKLGELVDLIGTGVDHQLGHRPICIVSHTTPSMDGYARISEKNHAAYASTWGYHVLRYRGHLTGAAFMDADAQRPIDRYGLFWQKPWAVLDALQRPALDGSGRLCEWVMWIDPDALFTNFDQSIEQIVSQHQRPIIVAREFIVPPGDRVHNFINAGVYFVANVPAGERFLRAVMDMFPRLKGSAPFGDQDAMHHLVFDLEGLAGTDWRALSWPQLVARSHPDVAIAPPRQFDGFYPSTRPPANEEGFWRPQDFVVHIAGHSVEQRIAVMRRILGLSAQARKS